MKFALSRDRVMALYKRFYLYPPPELRKHDRVFWLAMGLLTFVVLAFCIYFILYLSAMHDAYMTNAEDFGIMTQAIWNTAHGNLLKQTICNVISDTNCASPAGVTRFAIHFEPILFPIVLVYMLWPDPKTLLVVQTLVVASGAFPAFWLARLRLRNEFAGLAIALLYLLYPFVQIANGFDFHAVTLTSAFLLFMLYFMYTRRTVWMFVFAGLAMACKEQMPIVIMLFGVWVVLFQQRWKVGLGLLAFGGAWLALGLLVIMPFFSPTGRPLLMSRYDSAGGIGGILKKAILHPRSFLDSYVWEPKRFGYLQKLFSPAGLPGWTGEAFLYLPLLAPWVLVLALPSLAVNLLSSNKQMYSGLFHYNAEIVPFIIFATIEALVLLFWLGRQLLVLALRASRRLETMLSPLAFSGLGRRLSTGLLLVMCAGLLFSVVRADYLYNWHMPFNPSFGWPQPDARVRLAERLTATIPADASVSAQTKFVPHLSQRKSIYMFPYQSTEVDYVVLDTTSDIYPYTQTGAYASEVKRILLTGQYGIEAAESGFLVLKRGLPPPPLESVQPGTTPDPEQVSFRFPSSFCSHVYVQPSQVPNPLDVSFTGPKGGDLRLVGFNATIASQFDRQKHFIEVTTYWRVERPMTTPMQMLFMLESANGQEYPASADVPALSWCQPADWQKGSIVRMRSRVFNMQASTIPNGLAHMSMVLLPLAQTSSTIMNVQERFPLRILHAPDTVTASKNTNALLLKTITIVK